MESRIYLNIVKVKVCLCEENEELSPHINVALNIYFRDFSIFSLEMCFSRTLDASLNSTVDLIDLNRSINKVKRNYHYNRGCHISVLIYFNSLELTLISYFYPIMLFKSKEVYRSQKT